MAKPPPSLLLSFDFDGTLVHHEGDPPFLPALGDLLREFRRRGAAWLVNTGRGLGQTLEGLAQHGIFMLPDFVIARECEIFRPGWFKDWTDYGSWNRNARKTHAHFVAKHARFLEDMREFITRETSAEYLTGDFGEVGVVASTEEELDFICEHIDANSRQHADVSYHRNGVYLRFSHAHYSKGTSLRELARLLKVPRERIFAAGDNYNDLTMLDPSVAGYIACPSNALEPVKQHVLGHGGYVASQPASGGMIEALEYFFLQG